LQDAAHPANRTHNPQLHTRPATWKTTAQNTTRSNHCIIRLSSWWWAWWCPKHVEQAIRSAIKTSVASSWHFISTYPPKTLIQCHLFTDITRHILVTVLIRTLSISACHIDLQFLKTEMRIYKTPLRILFLTVL